MDETEFKGALTRMNESPCIFSKALLFRCCECNKAQHLFLAERQAIGCTSPHSRQRCDTLLPLLRDKAHFALGLSHAEGPLPHAKEIRVQCGGLTALQQQIEQQPVLTTVVEDIDNLLTRAETLYGSLQEFPFKEMVRVIGHFKVRGR